MKILELFGGLIRHGGEELFVLNCLRHLDAEDAAFDCLVAEDCQNDDFRRVIHEKGGRLTELHTPLHATRFSNHVYRPVRDYFKTHRYDVVHIHASSIAALALLAAAADRAGTPKVIVHSHATGKTDSLAHRLFRFLASLSERRHVDVYCACSKDAALWKFTPPYAEKAIIIKNGVDCERFRFRPERRASLRRQLGVGAGAFVICHVGRLCAVKNQLFLLEVFEQVAARIPDAFLLLVGEGEDREKLEAAAARKHLTERVLLTGVTDNVPDCLSAADVFAFPSEYEGFGIVALEAQCAGLPVVASEGVPREIRVTDDVCFLKAEHTEKAVLEWADKLCAYRGTARRDNSAAVAAAGYDIRSAAAQLKKLYGC